MALEAPFYYDPTTTAIAIGYTNNAFIADSVLPRISTGSAAKYTWRRYNLAQSFYIPPDIRVGRRSQVAEVEFTYDEVESSTQDFGLEDPIPQSDILNATNARGIPPQNMATEKLTELMMLAREKRVADKISTAALYPANNKVQLSGTSQFSNAASDPIATLSTAMDAMIARPNTMVFSRVGLTTLQRNPVLVKAYNGSDGANGFVPVDFLRQLFGLNEILVGEAWYNSSTSRYAAATMTRLWGKHVWLFRKEPITLPYTMTFGFTAETGGKVSMQRFDPNIGLRGGIRIRVGESLDENVAAPEYGYFIQDAFA